MAEENKIEEQQIECKDFACPKHGNISLRGRTFMGTVIRKFPKRAVIEFERTVYIKKYERYASRKTKLHARLPDCMFGEINLGDYIEILECRPISKIIHFVVVKKLRDKEFKFLECAPKSHIEEEDFGPVKKIRGGNEKVNGGEKNDRK